jgi:hypothetical protein
VAGAPPPSRTIQRIEEELGWEFLQIYGLTETTPLLTVNRRRAEEDELPAEERARRLGRAGMPALGTRISISDTGEVLARGNTVLEGYWEQPDATADALEGGWFHTGDGGTLDDEGYLSISDRKKDVIITGGENVSSIEVEDCLFSHPAVAEVAVIGVPSEKWGETIKALVVLAEGTSATSRSSSPTARRGSPATRHRRPSSSARSSRAPPPARCRSSSCASSTGRGSSARSTDRLTHRKSMVSNVDNNDSRWGHAAEVVTGRPAPAGGRAVGAACGGAVRGGPRRSAGAPRSAARDHRGPPGRPGPRHRAVRGPLTGTVVVQAPTAEQYAWDLAPSALLLVLAVLVARLLLGVVRSLRVGDPFTRANARRLATLGSVLIVGGTLLPAVQGIALGRVLDPLLLEGPRTWQLDLALWPALTGILVGFLAEVFSRGARLREDVEGSSSAG